MSRKVLSSASVLAIFLTSCIGIDIVFDTVDPELRLVRTLDVLGIGDSFRFEAVYYNNVGVSEPADLTWKSSDTSVATVDQEGWVTGHALGSTVIGACFSGADTQLVAEHVLEVADSTIDPGNQSRSGMIATTSSYELTGDFTLTEEDNGELTLAFGDNYRASTALPGLFVYLTNNPSTSSGAYEIAAVTDFSGAHSYTLPASIDLFQYNYVLYYCKPFNVKVGDGAIE